MNILLGNITSPSCQQNLQKPEEFFNGQVFTSNRYLVTLYTALSMSFVQHSIVAWGQTFDSHIEPLFKVQKGAVRAISYKPFLAYSLTIFKDLKLLRNVDKFKLRLLSFVCESINMIVPGFFHSFSSLKSSVNCHTTRQSTRGDLCLDNVNTSQHGLKSI